MNKEDAGNGAQNQTEVEEKLETVKKISMKGSACCFHVTSSSKGTAPVFMER